MKLKFPSLSVNEGFARGAVAAFAAQLDPTVGELCDIKTAVSEAVTNAIVHAYPDRVGEITLRCAAGELHTLEITVSDRGRGIGDIKRAREPLFTTSTDGERSGMGFTVMESLCDDVRVSSAPGRGTRVRLIKKLEPRRYGG